MPPISTGSAADFGVTSRFAPTLRNSRFTRSPTSSMAPSMAVATADPKATAPMAMALRRGARRIDCPTNRRNKSAAPDAEMLRAGQQLVRGNHDLVTIDFRLERNRVTPTLLADRRDIDGGCAVLEDHVGTFLIVALASTNLASVKGDGNGLIGPADGDDPHRHTIRFDREAVQHTIVYYTHRNPRHAFGHGKFGCR